MGWRLVEVAAGPEDRPMMLYQLAKRHRLVGDPPEQAAMAFNSVGWDCRMYELQDDNGTQVAILVISNVVRDHTCQLDMIPHPEYFKGPIDNENGFAEDLRRSMRHLFGVIFGDFRCRRVTAAVPETRVRTQKALRCLGFLKEGRLRKEVKFVGQEPEDLIMFGLLAVDYTKG